MSQLLSRRTFLKSASLALAASSIPLSAHAYSTSVLTAYFSWSGNTKRLAQIIHRKIGGDLFEIIPEKPYPTDYNVCVDQAKLEQQKGARPRLKGRVADMARYSTIFLGYPNWWASIPMPVASFLEQYTFSGKNIIPFVSHGGGGTGKSISAIKALCPTAKILKPFAVLYGGDSSLHANVDSWLKHLKVTS